MYTLTELRAIAEGANITDGFAEQMSLQEAFNQFILDEAFFGKKPVQKIQDAMDVIYEKVMAKPSIIIQNDPSRRELEKAFCDVFGFKSCSIYWANRPNLDRGPCTIPRAKFLHSGNITYKYGTNQKGFYDNKHELRVFINTDQILFTEGDMTSAEMTAILLHEVGHNFDYSIWALTNQWYMIFNAILNVILNPNNPRVYGRLTGTGLNVLLSELGGVYQALINIDDMLLNVIPPLGSIVRAVKKFGFNVVKALNAILSPVTMVIILPQYIVMTPFRYINNTFLRKGEAYADSFASSYGYSSELATALEKLNLYQTQSTNEDSFLAPFYDLALLQADLITTMTGGHGSTQQRIMRMVEKLDMDLEQSGLSASDKAAIREERAKLMKTYNNFLNADVGIRSDITSSFRTMIDNWYAGKNYMFIPTMDKENTYAK